MFGNGSELLADVVIYATGCASFNILVYVFFLKTLQRYEDPKFQIRRICGEEVADRCSPIWGLNKEGEINGVWRDLGVPGLWYMMGACLSLFMTARKPLFYRQPGDVPIPLKASSSTCVASLVPTLCLLEIESRNKGDRGGCVWTKVQLEWMIPGPKEGRSW